MRGCEKCSGLVGVGDAFCATCGAEVEKVRAGSGKVTIPVRRHGVVPPRAAAAPDREERQLSTALAVLFSLISVGWVGAALYWLL